MLAYKYEEYYTIEDYEKWEGDWELIRGVPYAMAPFALPIHQRINGKIFRFLDEKLENCPKCKVLIESEIYFSEDTVIRPDCFVICYPISNKLTLAPSIVFEVVSKSSSKRDEVLKYSIYEEEKVQYYVLIYPDLKKAKIYELINGKYQKVGDFQDKFTFKIDCEIEFDFKKIFKI